MQISTKTRLLFQMDALAQQAELIRANYSSYHHAIVILKTRIITDQHLLRSSIL